jgi:Icc-related predicted phosphoesterase
MRILLVSDLHYTLPQLDWVVSVAADYDLVVISGDNLDIESAVAADAQIAVVLEYLARVAAKTTVVACSGNHDLDGRNELGERAAVWLDAARAAGVLVDFGSFATDDIFVTICPWWDGPETCKLVDRQLEADAAVVGDRFWIWAYHAPPTESPTSWTGKRHYGDEELTGWIARYQPGLVLCGHVHQAPFANGGSWMDRIGSTAVLNAGRQIGPVPTRIELDTQTGEARWSSLEGVEEAALRAG